MTKDGWRDLVIQAVHEADNGNGESVSLLAEYFEECDLAKQALRNKGYGWTGLGILETVQQIEVQS